MATSVTDTKSNTAADIFSAINGNSGKKATTSTTADMENRFLTLLMTQIKNQDPLNPMDNAAVTTQLAQLNTVNGIEKLNATLSQLLSGYNEAQGLQAAGIIGKNVMVAGNSLPLTAGKSAFGGASLAAAADKVTLTIKDASGKIVQSKDLGAQEAGIMYFSWDGKDDAGNAMKEGNYTFSIAATAGGKKIDATAMEIGTVSAVTRSKDGFILDLGSLGDVAFKDVQQIL